ncbi:uncharacterized protein K460DRAFT_312609 [Cucurbitaria berberidis CBS 394.84]|uniref:Uncharacterized protein n=1 Tax=Cucurbitaria berberidis CBS 394.84 TaxID=1168544 RepID=A0A9P4L8X9_9PLEO|nr:uncharacterized protein K460DRAFT_312609 [Cucurbitaria berberidis CBS 394.84]KAF1845812.1 hypothetical protein K460DRAFT_312609 [Cucurbitaria berberidis CBS 394.84]
MNHVRTATSIASRRPVARRIAHVSRRTYATEPPPPPPPPNSTSQQLKEPSRVGAYYKTFGSPLLKCFLGALFTYQIAYYAWFKLETIEEQHDKHTEIKELQYELMEAIAQQKQSAQETLSHAVDAVEEATDRIVESVKEGADETVRATSAVGKVAKGGWWPW